MRALFITTVVWGLAILLQITLIVTGHMPSSMQKLEKVYHAGKRMLFDNSIVDIWASYQPMGHDDNGPYYDDSVFDIFGYPSIAPSYWVDIKIGPTLSPPAPPSIPRSPPPIPVPGNSYRPPPPPPPLSSSSSSNAGAIAGGIVGGLAAVGLLVGGGFFVLHKKKQRDALSKNNTMGNQQHPQMVIIEQGAAYDPRLIPSSPPPQYAIGSDFSATQTGGGVYNIPYFAQSPTYRDGGGFNQSPFMKSVLSSNNKSIASDPLMSLVAAEFARGGAINSNATQSSGLSRHSSGATPRSQSSGVVDVRPWQFPFAELSIERAIGEGSFGRVYLAKWHETYVAAKVLLDNSLTASQADAAAAVSLSSPLLGKLQQEAGLMASLRHPSVVQFLGVCTFPPCIVTEYCDRGSLTDVLKKAKADPAVANELTWPRRLTMAIDAAQGMLFLHNHRPQVLHRDLKSPNLLVDNAWKVKITDFNLSKIIEEVEGQLQTSNGGASNPRWLSPALLEGAPATTADDVFAFGVVMWEILVWDIPWLTTTPWNIMRSVTGGGRLDIPDRKDLPGPDTKKFKGLDGYVALMERCWAQDPAARPNFSEIIIELRKVM